MRKSYACLLSTTLSYLSYRCAFLTPREDDEEEEKRRKRRRRSGQSERKQKLIIIVCMYEDQAFLVRARTTFYRAANIFLSLCRCSLFFLVLLLFVTD
jgi:hypothetical protein